jgi:hypothetical protein
MFGGLVSININYSSIEHGKNFALNKNIIMQIPNFCKRKINIFKISNNFGALTMIIL